MDFDAIEYRREEGALTLCIVMRFGAYGKIALRRFVVHRYYARRLARPAGPTDKRRLPRYNLDAFELRRTGMCITARVGELNIPLTYISYQNTAKTKNRPYERIQQNIQRNRQLKREALARAA